MSRRWRAGAREGTRDSVVFSDLGIGAVSAGIAEALVETALGLLVAIPAVWFYNYVTGRIEYFNVEMDNSSSEMVDFFIKKTS